LNPTIFVVCDEFHERIDRIANSLGVKSDGAGLGRVLDLHCIQRLLSYGGVVLGYFQIDLAAVIEIKPSERRRSDLVCVASQRGHSLAFDVSRWQGVGGRAGSKWICRAGIARQTTANWSRKAQLY